MNHFEIRKTLSFEAAHRLPHVPAGHKCGRLHGHSFKFTLVVRAPLIEKLDWVMDYADLKMAAKDVLDRLDHHYLNDIPGLENPTSEVLARWIFNELQKKIENLSQVIVAETCSTECRYPAVPRAVKGPTSAATAD